MGDDPCEMYMCVFLFSFFVHFLHRTCVLYDPSDTGSTCWAIRRPYACSHAALLMVVSWTAPCPFSLCITDCAECLYQLCPSKMYSVRFMLRNTRAKPHLRGSHQWNETHTAVIFKIYEEHPIHGSSCGDMMLKAVNKL